VECNTVVNEHLFDDRTYVQQRIEWPRVRWNNTMGPVALHTHDSGCPRVLRDDLARLSGDGVGPETQLNLNHLLSFLGFTRLYIFYLCHNFSFVISPDISHINPPEVDKRLGYATKPFNTTII
jgi:hypothetical protein